MSEPNTDKAGTLITHGFLIAVSTDETVDIKEIEGRIFSSIQTTPGVVEYDAEYLGEIEMYAEGEIKES